MFIMDVPVVPTQETPIMLVQADAPAAGATLQPDYILQTCGETMSIGDPRSAMRGVDPAGMLQVYIEGRDNHVVELSNIKNVTLLQGTTVGKILAWTDNEGMVSFHYDPPTNYVGNDKAVFMAEFEGKRYKIVVELHVFNYAPPGEFGDSTCPAPQLIKITKPAKPSSGASGFGSGYDLNSVSITFADLQGAALIEKQ